MTPTQVKQACLNYYRNDANIDSDDSDDDASTSEGSMQKLLIIKEHEDERHFEKEFKWKIFGVMWTIKISKEKAKVLGS